MVKIRLRRMGAKKNPFYRIVVADSRYPRDGRFIEDLRIVKSRHVFLVDSLRDFRNAEFHARLKDVQNAEVQDDIVGREAFGFECVVQRVGIDFSAVNGNKRDLSRRFLPERHVVAEPALDAPALIVVAAGALGVVLVSGFEAVDVELAHVVSYFVEVFD